MRKAYVSKHHPTKPLPRTSSVLPRMQKNGGELTSSLLRGLVAAAPMQSHVQTASISGHRLSDPGATLGLIWNAGVTIILNSTITSSTAASPNRGRRWSRSSSTLTGRAEVCTPISGPRRRRTRDRMKSVASVRSRADWKHSGCSNNRANQTQ